MEAIQHVETETFDPTQYQRKRLRGVIIATIQEDGAGGHSVKGEEHKKLVKWLEGPRIELINQSPHSPEMNMCDLGFWHMMKSRVNARQSSVANYNGKNGRFIEDKLWEIMVEEWEKVPAEKLWNIAKQKEAVFKAVQAAGGGQLSTDPHTGIRVMYGTGD